MDILIFFFFLIDDACDSLFLVQLKPHKALTCIADKFLFNIGTTLTKSDFSNIPRHQFMFKHIFDILNGKFHFDLVVGNVVYIYIYFTQN